jgi:hypothetical protein
VITLKLPSRTNVIRDGANNDDSDIDGQSLFDESKTLATILQEDVVSPIDVLR